MLNNYSLALTVEEADIKSICTLENCWGTEEFPPDFARIWILKCQASKSKCQNFQGNFMIVSK